MRDGLGRSIACLLVLLLAACSDGGARAGAPPFPRPIKVLVANDDGVGAPGIDALVEALRSDGDLQVSVFAPSGNRSGSGGNVTRTGLVVEPATTISGFPAVSVSGFPADGVLFGVLHDLPVRPDLVVSGVNQGENISELVNLSGTVGAALAGVHLGIPAIAASLQLGQDAFFPEAAGFVLDIIQELKKRGNVLEGVALNVNYPGRNRSDLAGVRVVPLGRLSDIVGYTEKSTAGSARTFDAITASTNHPEDPPNDANLLAQGYVTLTPLRPDLAAPDRFEDFRFLER
jgi:5'-nucleotidase